MPPTLERLKDDSRPEAWARHRKHGGWNVQRYGRVTSPRVVVESRKQGSWASVRYGPVVSLPAGRQAWRSVNPDLRGLRTDLGAPRLGTLFQRLADQWESETVFESVVTRKALHPAYQRIIGLGRPVVPFILRRLANQPAQWFWALTAITGEDPAHGETTLDGAANAWLEWGRTRGLVDR